MKYFYAVTQTSVYRVTQEQGENGWPIVEKVAKRRGVKTSDIGMRLKLGRVVAITGHSDGIMLYDSIGSRGNGLPQYPESLNTLVSRGGKTSPVTALCTVKREAERCLQSNFQESWDLHWQAYTIPVLRKIGPNHPVWTVSQWVPDVRDPAAKLYLQFLKEAGFPARV